MFKYSKDGISVLSVLDARRAKKSGLFPVKIQVIHNRKQKYYSTGKELSKEDWEILAESKSRRLIEIRASVENSFSIIKSQVEALAERGDFCFDALSMRLGRCTGTTLNTAIQGKIDAFKLNGQVNSYYNRRKSWIPVRNLEKLRTLEVQKEKKEQFLAQLAAFWGIS